MSAQDQIITKGLSRPARLQVDPDTIGDDDKPPQSGTVFNIWFLKWSGGDSSRKNFTKLKFRVNIKKDVGYTKASGQSPICLFFARGCCYLGKKCKYLHRLPTENDYFPPTQDCFGRDKTADYKDDMDGVGSFNRVNRTLYVGGLHSKDNMENVLTKHFQEFGSIEKIRVLYNKGCAFVTYRLEAEAQFAKEAMNAQLLDDDEVLNVKWASEDPNPEAQRQEQQRRENDAMKMVQNLLSDVPKEGSRKRKQVEGQAQEEAKKAKSQHVPKQITQSDSHHTNENSFFSKASLDALKAARMNPSKPSVATKAKKLPIVNYSSDDDD